MRTNLFTTSLLSLALALVGCGDDSGTGPVFPDTGPRDSGVDGSTLDGGESDGSVDGGEQDAGYDAGYDGGYDAGIDSGPVNVCENYVPNPCPMEGCPSGQVCVDDGCGGMACTPGRTCSTIEAMSADCGGNACVMDEISGENVCDATVGSCTSDLQCPEGYRCEGDEGSEACVDRRVPCGSVAEQCPQGYVCAFDIGANFCRPAAPTCETQAQCPLGSMCLDPAGTGTSICLPAGSCEENADCGEAEAPFCTIEPSFASSACGAPGFCGGDVTCPDGWECLDLDGNGSFHCELEGGSCTSDSECPPRGVCAAPTATLPPACLVALEEST